MKNNSLKLITLNAWCGRSLHPLMRFFRKHKETTDIFCLQEVSNTSQEVMDHGHPDEHSCGPLFEKISAELKDFTGFFAHFEDNKDRMSQAMFVRKTVPLKTVQDFIVFQPERPQEKGSTVFSPRKLQYITVNWRNREVLVVNYHGLWNGGPKDDTPDRIAQSNSIKDFLDTFHGPKVLCGDFNLLPNTDSLGILEKGMRNLVKEFEAPSTRTPLYRHYENPDHSHFADYILVSPEVNVKKFSGVPGIVFDHSPLFL